MIVRVDPRDNECGSKRSVPHRGNCIPAPHATTHTHTVWMPGEGSFDRSSNTVSPAWTKNTAVAAYPGSGPVMRRTTSRSGSWVRCTALPLPPPAAGEAVGGRPLLYPLATSVVMHLVAADCSRDGPSCDMAPRLKKPGNLKGILKGMKKVHRQCRKMLSIKKLSIR